MKLPFQLKASSSGEALFAFEVSDVTFAQKLRCTLTYMTEVMFLSIFYKSKDEYKHDINVFNYYGFCCVHFCPIRVLKTYLLRRN